MKSKIYILLPVHNRKKITQQFIARLKNQTFQNYHLVLIDDGSADGTAEMVLESIPSATVLRGEGDWWWAGALQQGLDWLRQHAIRSNDIVLMINDDVVFDSDFLAIAQETLESFTNTLLQAVVCCDRTHEELDVGMVYDDKAMRFRPAHTIDEINCLTTNGLFMRWSDVILIGGFYPRWLPHYLSDYEFTIRAGRKGLRLHVVPELKLFWNRETTGPRKFDESNFLLFWKSFFSKRSAANPIYWTIFILLISRLANIPRNILRIWMGAFKTIVFHALSAMKAKFRNRELRS